MLKKLFKSKFLIVLLAIFAVMAVSVVRADEPTVVTTYEQLKTAVSSGGSIKLGADISITEAFWIQKDVVLDLDGHTLNLGANKIYVLSNSTFKDSSSNSSGKISGTGNSKIYAGLVSSGTTYPGKLTIESGTFVTSGNYLVRVAAESTLTMNGGVIKANQFGVYVTAASSKFTMNGGTVEATSAVGVYTVAGSEFTMNAGTVKAGQQAITSLGNSTINGGTVQATGQIGIYVSSGTLTVDGGTIKAPHDAINIKDGVGANVIIKNGTIEATDYTGVYVGEGDTLTINGGTITAGYAAINDKGDVVINGGHVVSDNAGYELPTINVLGTVQDDGTVVKATITVNDGLVEANGNGAAIKLQGNAVATVNGGTIKAPYENGNNGGAGIVAFKDTEVTINGGTISAYSFALSGNGSDSGQNEGTNAKFTITGGTLTSSGATGIYAPQVNGETVISGGTITGGRGGVEIRAGSLTVTDGLIIGNQEGYEYVENTNGTTTKGAAIAVCQHTTKQPITVNVSGGTFYGYIPFIQHNTDDYSVPETINYDISGGIFHSSGNETVQIGNYVNGPFIYGGKYTHYVTDYVKEGYGEKIENDPIRPEPNMKAVYKWREVSWRPNVENGTTNVVRHKTTFDDGTTIATEPDGQEPIVDPENPNILKLRTLYNDKIYIYPSPDDGYGVSSMQAFDENGSSLEIDSDNVFLAPDANSEVVVSYAKEEHGNIDPGESDSGEGEGGTIYGDSDNENSENNESGENSSWNPLTGDDCLPELLAWLSAAAVIVVFVI